MRAVVQRTTHARVLIDGRVQGEIGAGVVVFLGVGQGDQRESACSLADKIAHLRIFDDQHGKMNRSLLDTRGAALIVSQFTLYGDVRRGRRPGFEKAAPPEKANDLYEEFVRSFRALGVRVETGVFQARMDIEIVNSGPVTILLDSEKAF